MIDEAGQYRAARMPLLRDAVSYTISGRKAVQMRLSDSVNMDRIGTLLLFHIRRRGTTFSPTMPSPSASCRSAPRKRRSRPSGWSTRTPSRASITVSRN